MLARVHSLAVVGIEALPIEVEVHLASGLPSVTTVGLPHGAVREGRERVHAALINAGFEFPMRRVTVNLAPADVRKDGSAFDLPIAIALLAASGQIHAEPMDEGALLGELGLDGALRPVRGVLPVAIEAARRGHRWLVVPASNAAEAAVAGLAVLGAGSLQEVTDHLQGRRPIAPMRVAATRETEDGLGGEGADFADVRSQAAAKRALEVAAAGGHNVLLIGPPGSGKTMLARRLPSVLPLLGPEEALEVTKIHSVAGLLRPGTSLVRQRPFRAPHHTISDAGLAGGGRMARPGEVSLAHGGVLFLDELPEFRRQVLEVLRQPLEDGVMAISRAAAAVRYPARFILVAAMNPCPCGYRGDPRRECCCADDAVSRYLARLSGPLLDRIDIHLNVPPVPWRDLASRAPSESSVAVRARVSAARERQHRRTGGRTNALLTPREVRQFCSISEPACSLLEAGMRTLALSARAYHRILKLARTIADLEPSPAIAAAHVAEAIQYRGLDRGRGGGVAIG